MDKTARRQAAVWNISWAYSVPLIVVTVILHVVGFGLFNVKMVQVLTAARGHRGFTYVFAFGIGVTAMWAICLHAIEASVWAATYWFLGALPDGQTAMLYSLGAITTFGNSQISLSPYWQMLGAVEALDGIILIGLSTALLYGLIQRVWPIETRVARRPTFEESGPPLPDA